MVDTSEYWKENQEVDGIFRNTELCPFSAPIE